MKYQNETGFRHDAPDSLGVLMVNLGTPDAPSTVAVRRYLAEFLSDPRVIEMPPLLWMAILHGVILRIRPKRSAHAYRQVWSERGSPLLDISRRQAEALQRALEQRNIGPLKVELAMRYGSPSIAAGLGALRRANVRRLLVLPMYPQYSATTTASAKVPSECSPSTPNRTHRLCSPLRQYSHCPQDNPGSKTTSAPNSTPSTESPTASTTPAPSAPPMWGNPIGTPGIPPRTKRSRWLRAEARSRTRTSPAPGSGSGRSP